MDERAVEKSGRIYRVVPCPTERTFEMLRGLEVIARWRWDGGEVDRVTAWCPEALWTFCLDEVGLPRIGVRAENYEESPAAFEGDANGGGVLVCSEGPCFYWKAKPGREGEWRFMERDGTVLVHFQLEGSDCAGGAGDPRGLVRLEPLALESPELPLLILLGWIVAVQSAAAAKARAPVPARVAGSRR